MSQPTSAKPVAIRLTAEQAARLDRLRDLAPREAYARRLMDEALDAHEKQAQQD